MSRIAADRFELYTAYHSQRDRVAAGQPVQLDLNDHPGTLQLITEMAPQAIIHAAAANPGSSSDMAQVNADGSRLVAEAAAAVGARLVHVSTDMVHDGRNPPYADDAQPTPINLYGQSKAKAEAEVQLAKPDAAIVRTSLIYGLDEMDRGTAGFVARLDQGETLLLFNDVYRQPVWVDTLAKSLLKLVEIEFSGTLNVVGRQVLTREEFGRRMLAWWKINVPASQIKSGRAADVSSSIPLDLRLPVEKAGRLLSLDYPGVDDVLAMRATV